MTFISLKQAALAAPGQPDPNTVRHWMSTGILTNAGHVKLRFVMVGGRVYTTQEWMTEFFEAVTTAGIPAKRRGRPTLAA